MSAHHCRCMSTNTIALVLVVGGTISVPVITLALAWFLCPTVYIHAFNWFWRQRLGLRVKHVTVAGYTFCYMERGGAKSNAGPAILLLHGFSAHKDMWLPMLRFLDLECRVVSVDMPGHEGTSRIAGEDYSIQGQVARIHQFVGAVGLDSSPYHLVGTSMGGCIAGVYAAHHPKELCAITLICPAGLQYPCDTPFIRELRALEGTDMRNARISLIPETPSEMRGMLDLCAYTPIHLHKQILKALVNLRCQNNDFYRELFVAITSESSRHALQEALPLITTPTQVIWGQEDKVVDVSGATVMEAVLPSCRVDLLERCGHSVVMERPRKASSLLAAFRHSLDFDGPNGGGGGGGGAYLEPRAGKRD
ncbi:monoacylglycerol lipase ABHD6 isoform X2 [Lampetra fluviatilis]